MSTQMYPMSKPVLIERIKRSAEVCAIILSSPVIEYQLNRRKLNVKWKVNGPNMVVPANCAQPLLILLHQHNVYVQMITNSLPIVQEDRMDPQDLEVYVSVAAYLRDVILAFKEEWEDDGYKTKFRSARLEFHIAMVLTGGTFNDRNVRKMQKKFNVTWDHFAQRVEVTDVMKLNGKAKEYHKLICYKDENMCGLDDYPGVDHGTGSLDMIERFIKAKEASWAAKKEAATSAKPEAPVEKGNGKQGIRDAHEEPAESVNGKERPDENATTSRSHNIVKTSAKMGAIGREHALSKEDKQDKLTMSSSHKRLSDGPKVSDGVRVKRWGPRNLSRKDRQEWMVRIAAEMHPNAGDRCVEQRVISELHIPTSKDHRCNLMRRGCIEGDGVTVTTSLLAWMIERYRILIGLPLDEHLNGQIIPQSPDQYENMQEHDYYEALGIERLYAALVNAEESPGHLIHLAHALGRAAKETNMLSESKPNTLALDPLPPTMFFRPQTPRGQGMSMDNDVQSIIDSSTESTDADEHDQSVSGHASTENEAMCDDVSNASGTSVLHVADACKEDMVIDCNIMSGDGNSMHSDVDDINEDKMDTEEESGHGDDHNDKSRDGTHGEGKRKRAQSLAVSPQVAHDSRDDKKRSKLLDPTLRVSDRADNLHPARSVTVSDGTEAMGVWSMAGYLSLARPIASETHEQSTSIQGRREVHTSEQLVEESTVIPDQGKVPTAEQYIEECEIDNTDTEAISAATQAWLEQF
ncbi:hypothetical protein BDR07DRAFT_1486434 [Suillus spraguei]|nr:hypothetical protein BDR07DRAFT_1486434 [Suillus spraguei]